MTLQSQWPEHKALNQNRKSDFDTFYRGVAAAMREQGMESFNHLMDRIQWVMEQDGMDALFDVRFDRQTVHAAISHANANSNDYLHSNTYGFSKTAQVVALVLEKDPDDLFPHVINRHAHFDDCESGLAGVIDDTQERAERRAAFHGDVHLALSGLPAKDQAMFKEKHGLDGDLPVGHEVLADYYNMTTEGIRVNTAKTAKALGMSARGQALSDYLADPLLSSDEPTAQFDCD